MTDSRRGRILELFLGFFLLPPALALAKPHGWIYLLLWLLGLSAWRRMGRQDYRLRQDWNPGALDRKALAAILFRFLPCAAALLGFVWAVIPEHLWSLPRERPQIWAMVMILYPLLSVLPQELLFRSYIFHRFRPLFGERGAIAVSALVFGWAHVVLMNGVAVIFSTAGGLLFAHTYAKTRSLAAACFEHALYGCWIFTIGMGFYFYHGQAVR